MTKDELLKLMKIYVDISEDYMHNFPNEDTWNNNEVAGECILSWKREGKLQLLKELMNLFEGDNNGQ